MVFLPNWLDGKNTFCAIILVIWELKNYVWVPQNINPYYNFIDFGSEESSKNLANYTYNIICKEKKKSYAATKHSIQILYNFQIKIFKISTNLMILFCQSLSYRVMTVPIANDYK